MIASAPLWRWIRDRMQEAIQEAYEKILADEGIVLSRAEKRRLLIMVVGDVLAELQERS